MDPLAAIFEDLLYIALHLHRVSDLAKDPEGQNVSHDIGHSRPVAMRLKPVRVVP